MTSPVDEYVAWKKKSKAVGCVFARYLATNRERFGQRIETIDSSEPANIATDIATSIDALVSDPDVAAATLLLPEVTSLRTLVLVAQELAQKPHWNVKSTTLVGTPGGDMVAFAVTRDIPFSATTCPSEALVLEPFPEFPATRQAPHTALEIFVGVPPALDPKTNAPTTKANLAHVEIDAVASAVHASMWEMSKKLRLESLNGFDDPRAKAKVTFVVPRALAQSLGVS